MRTGAFLKRMNTDGSDTGTVKLINSNYIGMLETADDVEPADSSAYTFGVALSMATVSALLVF